MITTRDVEQITFTCSNAQSAADQWNLWPKPNLTKRPLFVLYVPTSKHSHIFHRHFQNFRLTRVWHFRDKGHNTWYKVTWRLDLDNVWQRRNEAFEGTAVCEVMSLTRMDTHGNSVQRTDLPNLFSYTKLDALALWNEPAIFRACFSRQWLKFAPRLVTMETAEEKW